MDSAPAGKFASVANTMFEPKGPKKLELVTRSTS
jgi:hypothetical protein